MRNNKFATAINCIDGRTIDPIINWVKDNYSVDFVDMLTHPGVDKFLTAEGTSELKSEAGLSASAHKSEILIIAGHSDCAANPVSDEMHMSHVNRAVEQVNLWQLPFKKIVGVFIKVNGSIEKIVEK